MVKPVPVWWHSRTQWPETEGVIGGRFWKPGCKGFDGLLYEETHPAEPLYDQRTVDLLIAELLAIRTEGERLWNENQSLREQLHHVGGLLFLRNRQIVAAAKELKALDDTMKPVEPKGDADGAN